MQSTIMIVEDEYITAMDIQRNLEKFGHSVVGIASSGEEAIEMAKKLMPNLILMDVVLNGKINGTEAARQIINAMSVPIIFITSYNDQDTFKHAKLVNPYGYLTKPFNNRDLSIAVELALYKFQIELETVSDTIKLQNEFLANMSHELRTPLHGIIGFSQLLCSEKIGSLTHEQREYLQDILSCSNHILQIANDVLDLAKVAAGRLDFFPEKINLNALVNDVIDTVKILMLEKTINLEMKIDETLNDIFLDPVKLKQVLYNYLTNAIKFSNANGKINFTMEAENERSFKITVKDEGIGIQEKDINKLFIPFNQIEQSANKKYQGTGLGLAIVKRLVEAQGGQTGVDSIYQHGCSFYAILPRIFNNQSNTESLKNLE